MKIRLISDLHLDINAKYDLDFKHEKLEDMFTIVAGDICGSPEKSAQWLKWNLSRGAFVSGNHDVYDTSMPIEDIKAFFAKNFPKDGNITYFDNEVGVISKDIGENILLVADVMYTDYKLPAGFRNPTGDIKKNICIADPWRSPARGGMNDFNYGTCKKIWKNLNDENSLRPKRLMPEYYLEHHEKAFSAVTDAIERNSSKEIILVTHHCLSEKCIDHMYDNDSLNASYASNKEDWILAHPNIKCICSGHIHARKSFKVGNALYVMNALGYCSDQYKMWSNESNAYVPWTPDCIIDTNSWTAEFKPHPIDGWESKYKSDNEKLMKILPFLM